MTSPLLPLPTSLSNQKALGFAVFTGSRSESNNLFKFVCTFSYYLLVILHPCTLFCYFCDCYIILLEPIFYLTFADEWNSIFGDFSKFGVGVLSVVIDVMYMFQHYVLYATPEYKRVSDDERVTNNVTNYPVIAQ